MLAALPEIEKFITLGEVQRQLTLHADLGGAFHLTCSIFPDSMDLTWSMLWICCGMRTTDYPVHTTLKECLMEFMKNGFLTHHPLSYLQMTLLIFSRIGNALDRLLYQTMILNDCYQINPGLGWFYQLCQYRQLSTFLPLVLSLTWLSSGTSSLYFGKS